MHPVATLKDVRMHTNSCIFIHVYLYIYIYIYIYTSMRFQIRVYKIEYCVKQHEEIEIDR